MVEKLENVNMKDVILKNWKAKLNYPFNYKDLEELEKIIDYYDIENQKLKKQLEEINYFISKAGFVNIQQLMLDYCAKVELVGISSEQAEYDLLEILDKDKGE